MFGFFFHYLFIQNRLFEVVLEEKKISYFWQFGKVIKTKWFFCLKQTMRKLVMMFHTQDSEIFTGFPCLKIC